MASFIETPRFPEKIAYSSRGGPVWSTSVARTNGGSEQRTQLWSSPLHSYDAMHGVKLDTDLDTLQAFFMCTAGMALGFRFKDWKDYRATYGAGTGILNTAGVGNGTPISQLCKQYVQGAFSFVRTILKPVTGTTAVQRNSVNAIVGIGAGNYALDTTTGIVTWVADANSNASAISVGVTTSVTLAANPGGLIAGKLLYLTGFTGADAALVNGIAHTINSVSGAGPFVFILGTITTGKTITVGTGNGAKYPQVSDTLNWIGEFDVPCRFDADAFSATYDDINASTLQIAIVELRNP